VKHVTTQGEITMNRLKTMKTFTCSRPFCCLSIALVTLTMLFATTGATAGCGDLMGARLGIVPKMPFLTQPESGVGQTSSDASIVGLWHVTYMSGGQLFYEAFDQWHSDGTEFENANVPSVFGNICLGVWTLTDKGTIHLNHIGWNFDSNGNSIGTFTLTETNVVLAGGNGYRGTFDYKVFDVNGNLLMEQKGTQTATRITVH
jgi:hypothetical protein